MRKGGLSLRAKTLFSTIVHSTSSSWITTSFFRIFIAYSSSVDFISASITCNGGETPRAKATIRQRLKKNQANEKAQEHLFSLTLPKLPFPSRARKLKSLSRTRSIFPDGKLNRRWSDGVITFLPCPSFAFCRDRRVLGYRLHSLTCQIESN